MDLARLNKIAETEGIEDINALIEHAMFNDCPGICISPDCGFVCSNIEPDQEQGWCEHCDGNTVVSCLVLAGIV